jgi:hypothetical protein
MAKHMHKKSNEFAVIWSERCNTVIKKVTANAPSRASEIRKTLKTSQRERELFLMHQKKCFHCLWRQN